MQGGSSVLRVQSEPPVTHEEIPISLIIILRMLGDRKVRQGGRVGGMKVGNEEGKGGDTATYA
jgi:hypothetical protein